MTLWYVLSHKTGFTKLIMKTMLGLIEQGIDFIKVTSLIQCCRRNHIYILQKQQVKLILLPSKKLMEEVKSIIVNTLSRLLLTSTFLQQLFFSSREKAMTWHMCSLSSEESVYSWSYIQGSCNIGYFRSDKNGQHRITRYLMNLVKCWHGPSLHISSCKLQLAEI